MSEPILTANDVRGLLAAAISAAGSATANMAEKLRDQAHVEQIAREAAEWAPGMIEPMEDVIEPLVDALQLAIRASGTLLPYHRMTAAFDRYLDGEDL